MEKACTRVFYDATDGRILATLHRVEGGLPRKPIEKLQYLDIPYENFDPMKYDIERIENGKPVLVSTYVETEQERQIRELEDQLLLQAENEIGGIL
ncbi:hypothetical protein [Solibacillus sp. FSL W8-0372]|uniref:hypothetical protein n=1 Tax=Solibacillus sp. FSL W8-0372 TaxID=2921713 RepID=UPI0030CF0C1F